MSKNHVAYGLYISGGRTQRYRPYSNLLFFVGDDLCVVPFRILCYSTSYSCSKTRKGINPIDIQEIINSAKTRWSKEDDCFLVTSELCTNVAGTGDTKEDALEMFCSMLDDAYQYYLQGRFTPTKKRGRKVGNPGKVVSIRLNEQVIEFLHKEAKLHHQTLGSIFEKFVLPHMNQ